MFHCAFASGVSKHMLTYLLAD